jgi:FK506-binding nuclear protein
MEEDEEMSGEDEEEWEDEEDEIDAKLMNALANKMKAEAGKITEVGSDDEEEEEEEDEDEDEEMEESPEPEVKKEEPKKKQEAKKAEPAAKKAPAKAEAKKEVPAKAEVKKDTPAKAEPKTEEKPAKVEAKKEASNNKKTLPSGLVIEDGKVGNGPRAKNGKKVCVRYIGKLASNDKIFDSNTKGSPFTFRLGAGDVIKGWDLGVQGMNVGGTRILTIPPKLAYGARGAPPDIPKNATLIFEIKLLEIKN